MLIRVVIDASLSWTKDGREWCYCGLDVVLRTPGFMLSDSQDGEEVFLKWLLYLVAA